MLDIPPDRRAAGGDTVDDLISRAAAIKAFTGKPPEYYHTSYIVGELNTIPVVDAVPVVHGRWKLVAWHRGLKVVECSICIKRAYGATDYCPNCGAKMDGERRDEDGSTD